MSLNIDMTEMGYNSIAHSMNNLVHQQRIRHRIDINRDIQIHVEKKADLVVAGADDSVISIYTRTITDLEEERTTSIHYERYMSGRI